MAEQGKERRKFMRITAATKVKISRYDPKEKVVTTSDSNSKNLSANGVLVPSSKELPKDSFVKVDFTLPCEKTPTAFFGKVSRAIKIAENSFEIAVAMLEMPKGSIKKIEKFIVKNTERPS